jgi:hypothetical protein
MPRGTWCERRCRLYGGFIMQTRTITLTKADVDKNIDDRTDSWICVDCGFNTAPGVPNAERIRLEVAAFGSITATVCENSEAYWVRSRVWKAANMNGWGGCLCIGCLENRLGRMLKPKDFDRDDPFHSFPGTKRLLSRRGAAWTPDTALFAA